MTIYFQGSELQDFATISGIPSHSASSGIYNSSNTRCAIIFGSGGEDLEYVQVGSLSLTEFWMHARLGFTGSGFAGTQRNWLKFMAGGVERISFIGAAQSSAFTIQARKLDGTYTSIGTSGSQGNVGSTNKALDIYCRLGNPGELRVYLNGTSVIADAAFNLTWSGVTAIDAIRWGTATGTVGSHALSELIIADWSTLSSKLVTRVPDAAGNYAQWDGAGFASVDEINPDATYVTSDVADERASYLLTDFPTLGTNERIESVKAVATAIRDAAGPQNLNLFTRIASTDYDDSDQSLTVAASSKSKTWDASPATSTYWTVTELNGTEFGVRSRT